MYKDNKELLDNITSIFKLDINHIISLFMLSHNINNREDVYYFFYKKVNYLKAKKFLRYIKRLQLNEPIQYISNISFFMNFKFYVNSNVLIPRYDSEVIIEYIKNIKINTSKEHNILDLCCGSGCLLTSISLLLKHTNISYYGFDISYKALKIASKNSLILNTKNNIKYYQSDMLNINNYLKVKFDIIIFNPPYINLKDLSEKYYKYLKYEPIDALYGGIDGLDYYRALSQEAYFHLKKNGILIIEIPYNEDINIISIFKKKFDIKKIIKDYNSIIRALVFTLKV